MYNSEYNQKTENQKTENQKTENQLTEIIKFSNNTFKNNLVIAPACSLCDSTSYVRFRSSYRLLVTNWGL